MPRAFGLKTSDAAGRRVETPSSPQILLVDDERTILRSIGRMLERRGYGVRGVESAEEALAALAEQRFDAVVCDLQLPGMRGEALYDHVRRACPDCARRFIVATGDIEPATAFLDRTGCPYLEKPYELTDLLELLSLLGAAAPSH